MKTSFADLIGGIMRSGKTKDPEDGIEQAEVPGQELTADRELSEARSGKPTLLDAPEASVAKVIRKRWDRHDTGVKKLLAQLKVNFMRHQGHTFAQIHPEDPNRVYVPAGSKQRLPPSINKIRRTVHRYMAQVTADEPVIEGVAASHSDTSRDAAEAATSVLRGEWFRMKLHNELQRTTQLAAVFRSAFWFFEYDGTAGGRVKAQKFFADEQGQRYLGFVNNRGEEVPEEENAAEIWQGDTKLHVLSPTQVRWEGARYAHDASEVLVGMLVPLRDLYESQPNLREVKLCELLSDVPPDAENWISDLTAERPKAQDAYRDDDLGLTGADLDEEDTKLDAKVFVLHYFVKANRRYPKGFHGTLAGKYLAFRGELRYGVIPVAHFKLLDDLADKYGLGLVDLLRDPQELLDFVNGQILRYLQSLKRRWFVPMHSGVKARDLMNPTRSMIEYNPQAGKPEPETQQEIPNSLVNWVDRFERAYDDESGIHDIMQGKQVPGVTSGRHAEALRSGDETILGLTRTQLQAALEYAGRIILEISKVEWTRPRRVQFFEGREYVDEAFASTDLGDCSRVQLQKSTLLMLTPAQKLESITNWAKLGWVSADEVRRLAPLGDTAGFSLSEDPHYRRARRQNTKFLAGPPAELLKARDSFVRESEALEQQVSQINDMLGMQVDPETVQVALQAPQQHLQAAQQEWQQTLQQYAPSHRTWEDDPGIARIHAVEHMIALASDKCDRFPEWWVEMFEQHAKLEWQVANPQAPSNVPKESINFKDLPPEGQSQMAAQAGLQLGQAQGQQQQAAGQAQ